MEVWLKTHDLSIYIFILTNSLPRYQDDSLTSQVRRSANSISANITEVFGRRSGKDKIWFYVITREPAYETQNHLLYGKGVDHFEQKEVIRLLDEADQIIYPAE